MSTKLQDLLADEAKAAEAFEDDQDAPYPAHVKITRGNPRSKVLQVRLNPEELDALERIARRRELPTSTIAREQLLRLIAEDHSDTPGDTAQLRRQLVSAAALINSVADELDRPETLTTKQDKPPSIKSSKRPHPKPAAEHIRATSRRGPPMPAVARSTIPDPADHQDDGKSPESDQRNRHHGFPDELNHPDLDVAGDPARIGPLSQ